MSFLHLFRLSFIIGLLPPFPKGGLWLHRRNLVKSTHCQPSLRMHIDKTLLQPRASVFFKLPVLFCIRSERLQSADCVEKLGFRAGSVKSLAIQGDQNLVARGSAKLALRNSCAISLRLKNNLIRLLEMIGLCRKNSIPEFRSFATQSAHFDRCCKMHQWLLSSKQ